jgi:hypothetical protein
MKTPRALEIELVELFASPHKHALNKFRPIVQHNLFYTLKIKNKKKKKKLRERNKQNKITFYQETKLKSATHIRPKATISPLYMTHHVTHALYPHSF